MKKDKVKDFPWGFWLVCATITSVLSFAFLVIVLMPLLWAGISGGFVFIVMLGVFFALRMTER